MSLQRRIRRRLSQTFSRYQDAGSLTELAEHLTLDEQNASNGGSGELQQMILANVSEYHDSYCEEIKHLC